MASQLNEVQLKSLLATGQIPDSAKKWLNGLKHDDSIVVHEIAFQFGEEIGNFQRFCFTGDDKQKEARLQNSIGILLSGEAEIYELEFVEAGIGDKRPKNKFLAYRPIRLLRTGDIFGDFRFADQHVVYGSAQSQPEENTRPGEKWRFCAGRKSVFVRGHVSHAIRKKYFECDLVVEKFESIDGEEHIATSVFQAHSYVNRLNKIANDDELYVDNAHLVTKIIFIDHDHFAPDSAAVRELLTSANPKELLFLEILKESWRRAKYYRDGINSFNYGKVVKFISEMEKIDMNKDLPKPTDKKAPQFEYPAIDKQAKRLFFEALYDAINRPLRKELLFAREDRLIYSNYKSHAEYVQLEENSDGEKVAFLFPTLPEFSKEVEFMFPLDLYNYYLNAGCKHYKCENTVFGSFRGNRPSKKPRTENPYTKRRFFIELANKAIEKYRTAHPDYPFTVRCEDIVGAERNCLVLFFRRREEV